MSGTPRFGATLTATPGAWDDGTTQTYAWLRAGSPIADATGTAYTPTVADLGLPLSFRVTSTKHGYSKVVSTSAATAAVAPATLPKAAAAVTGVAQVGQRLNAAVTGWDSGVVGDLPVAAERCADRRRDRGRRTPCGRPTSVRRSACARPAPEAGFSTASVTSAPTAGIAAGTQTRGKVRISGAPKVGRTLKARPTGFDAGTTVSYCWLVGGKARGTKPSLKLTGKMAGKRVVLRVVVTKPGYRTLTVASKATGKVRAVKNPSR